MDVSEGPFGPLLGLRLALFIGTHRRMDTATLERHGFDYQAIRSSGLKGKSPLALLRALIQLPLSLMEALKEKIPSPYKKDVENYFRGLSE